MRLTYIEISEIMKREAEQVMQAARARTDLSPSERIELERESTLAIAQAWGLPATRAQWRLPATQRLAPELPNMGEFQ